MHPDPEILLAEPTHLACQNSKLPLNSEAFFAQSHKYKQGNDLFASTKKKKKKERWLRA